MQNKLLNLMLVFFGILCCALGFENFIFHELYFVGGFICFITLIIRIIRRHKTIVYTYPKNGDKITFLASNASHKSTAYYGFSGIVEDSRLDGFVIHSDNGSSLICGVSHKRISTVTWRYYDDINGIKYVSKYIHK